MTHVYTITSKQIQILILIMHAYTPAEIADMLAISRSTLSYHIERLEKRQLLISSESTGKKHTTVTYTLSPTAYQIMRDMSITLSN